MRHTMLMVFLFLSGVCLGFLLSSREDSIKHLPVSERGHILIVQRVIELPEWGPILADHGKTTFYFSSDEGFSSATAAAYSTLVSKVSEAK